MHLGLHLIFCFLFASAVLFLCHSFFGFFGVNWIFFTIPFKLIYLPFCILKLLLRHYNVPMLNFSVFVLILYYLFLHINIVYYMIKWDNFFLFWLLKCLWLFFHGLSPGTLSPTRRQPSSFTCWEGPWMYNGPFYKVNIVLTLLTCKM